MEWAVVALVVAIVLIAFTLVSSSGRPAVERAHRLPDGSQEARVVVDRGYTPSHIELDAGVPTVLRFDRREDDPCTELLVSELWPNAHRLVAHGETPVRFTPQRPGRYAFTCGMGMYSGELIVRKGSTV